MRVVRRAFGADGSHFSPPTHPLCVFAPARNFMQVHSDPSERDGQQQHFYLGQGWLLEALQAAGSWPPAECTALDASWRHGGPSRPRARVSRARRAIHPQGCRGPHALRNKWRACIRKVPVEEYDRAMARRIVFSHLDDMATRPEAAEASLQRMLRALRARTAAKRCVHVSPALPLCEYLSCSLRELQVAAKQQPGDRCRDTLRSSKLLSRLAEWRLQPGTMGALVPERARSQSSRSVTARSPSRRISGSGIYRCIGVCSGRSGVRPLL